MDIPDSPRDLGFKYKKWRKNQKEIIQKVIDEFTSKDVAMLELPTGTGKSLIAMSVVALAASKGYVVVSSKSLQNQYMKDFGVPTVKGRNNFRCLIANTTCNKAPCVAGFKCNVVDSCPYVIQKRNAMEAPVSIHNYAYYLTAFNYTDSWGFADVVVFDEAHTIDSNITSFVNLSLKIKDVKRYGLDISDDYMSLIKDMFKAVRYEMTEIKAKIQSEAKWDDEYLSYDAVLVEEYDRLNKLKRKLNFLLENYSYDNWVVEVDNKYIRFRPIWTSKFARFYFSHGNKFLLMSATIGDVNNFIRVNGIDEYFGEDNFFVIRGSSLFDIKRRPAVFVPVAKFVYSNKRNALRSMLSAVDFIISKEADKGIIHAVSYEYAKYIYDNSRYRNRMFWHSDSDGRDDAIDNFIKSDDGILVSPSVHTGLDFRDDLARWQIILKVPYASLGDEVVKRRAKTNRLWYIQDAVIKIVQAYGRIVRNENDYGRTYILDKEFYRLIRNYSVLFPKWFLDAVVFVFPNELNSKIEELKAEVTA